MKKISIIGGGLAGSEAAWQALLQGFAVSLYEMRPLTRTPAHQTDRLAELVCSNTFKSTNPDSAPGQLKYEMERFNSLILSCAKKAAVPAGQALGVDRNKFSELVTQTLESHPRFTRISQEASELPNQTELQEQNTACIVATGPLTSDRLAHAIQELTQSKADLHFYDAIAPIIDSDSIDYEYCFRQDRYSENSQGDYLNLPLSKEEYESFVNDIESAEKVPLHAFESTNYFESCLPIEVMVERGRETLRFGPMKPVGLIDPRTGRRPWANIQLRVENEAATMYSMVGFQTKMKFPEQKRVFQKLSALRNAEFLRFGSVHRNTYLDAPTVLNNDLSFKRANRIFLAGQITGVEGYMESTAMGLLAARAALARIRNEAFCPPPQTTMIGALLHYVTCGSSGRFQPMNSNMGLLPPIAKRRGVSKSERRRQQCLNAKTCFDEFLKSTGPHAANENKPALPFR